MFTPTYLKIDVTTDLPKLYVYWLDSFFILNIGEFINAGRHNQRKSSISSTVQETFYRKPEPEFQNQ